VSVVGRLGGWERHNEALDANKGSGVIVWRRGECARNRPWPHACGARLGLGTSGRGGGSLGTSGRGGVASLRSGGSLDTSLRSGGSLGTSGRGGVASLVRSGGGRVC
jgi:hypothetical protein